MIDGVKSHFHLNSDLQEIFYLNTAKSLTIWNFGSLFIDYDTLSASIACQIDILNAHETSIRIMLWMLVKWALRLLIWYAIDDGRLSCCRWTSSQSIIKKTDFCSIDNLWFRRNNSIDACKEYNNLILRYDFLSIEHIPFVQGQYLCIKSLTLPSKCTFWDWEVVEADNRLRSLEQASYWAVDNKASVEMTKSGSMSFTSLRRKDARDLTNFQPDRLMGWEVVELDNGCKGSKTCTLG